MAKRRNYRADCKKAQVKIRKLAATICDKALRLDRLDSELLASEPTACEESEAFVALWETAAADANDILMAAMNTATEVNVGLQAAYAARAIACQSI